MSNIKWLFYFLGSCGKINMHFNMFTSKKYSCIDASFYMIVSDVMTYIWVENHCISRREKNPVYGWNER